MFSREYDRGHNSGAGQLHHPNVHHAWSQWSEDQTLHVVAVYINPFRWAKRRQLFHDFRLHMERSANVRLHVVEVAFGDRPFEVTSPGNPDDVQLRTTDALWHKENALNIGIQRIAAGWKYGCTVDADFHFTRHDWALETIHQLQHYAWVQMFSSYAVQDPHGRPLEIRPSFAYSYHERFQGSMELHAAQCDGNQASHGDYYKPTKPERHGHRHRHHARNTTPGATGGAWAFTRESFDAVGGLLDTCILGAADWYMAFGLIGNTTDGHPEAQSCGKAYADSIRRWQVRAFKAIEGNIGFVDNFAIHGWHGELKNRGYGSRWMILRDHEYDPLIDITRDWQGLLRFTGNKPRFRDEIRRYFLSRSEDSTECGTSPLV
jgi:hypothetical protein